MRKWILLILLSMAAFIQGCKFDISLPRSGGIGMDAGVAVIQDVSLEASTAEFDIIYIESPLGADDVLIKTNSSKNSLTVSAQIWAESTSDIQKYLNGISKSIEGKTLRIIAPTERYFCYREEREGNLKLVAGSAAVEKTGTVKRVSGTCLAQVSIELSPKNKTRIYINGVRVDRSSAHSFADMINGMKRMSFGDEKLKVLRSFVMTNNSTQRFISIQEVRTVLEQFSFDSEKVSVSQILSGHVSDPENVAKLTDLFSFDSDREAAITLLQK